MKVATFLLALFLVVLGSVVLWTKVSPWAFLGVFLFVWGNNVTYSEQLRKLRRQ